MSTINTTAGAYGPVATPDELLLYFSSDRSEDSSKDDQRGFDLGCFPSTGQGTGAGDREWPDWISPAAPLPHNLTIDLGTAQVISGFIYTPRQDWYNGRIGQWSSRSSPTPCGGAVDAGSQTPRPCLFYSRISWDTLPEL